MLTPGLGWTSRVVAAALKGVYQISRENGMQPGQDMLAAMEEADACGATIVYGDQVLTPSPPPLTSQHPSGRHLLALSSASFFLTASFWNN